ncbi:MAG TPA: hypothetical protein DEH11_00320 [Actinobacteria bacterium]|nr:hypothetical protein [Actinomycetota bacterium]
MLGRRGGHGRPQRLRGCRPRPGRPRPGGAGGSARPGGGQAVGGTAGRGLASGARHSRSVAASRSSCAPGSPNSTFPDSAFL